MPDAEEIGGLSLSMESALDFVVGSSVVVADEDSPFVCFLRFFDPESFLRECVSPCSASLRPRAISRCLSASFVGRMTMTFSSV